MNVDELLLFIEAKKKDGSITGKTVITSRSGGYEMQHIAYVSVETDHNGIEYKYDQPDVLNISADE